MAPGFIPWQRLMEQVWGGRVLTECSLPARLSGAAREQAAAAIAITGNAVPSLPTEQELWPALSRVTCPALLCQRTASVSPLPFKSQARETSNLKIIYLNPEAELPL